MRICRNGHYIDKNSERIKADGHTECAICYQLSMKRWKLKNKKRNLEHQLKYQAKNIEKNKAHDAVAKALISGRLVKPDRCAKCADIKKLHAHHPDYSKRLEVIWLCSKCHKEIHQALRTAFGIQEKEGMGR